MNLEVEMLINRVRFLPALAKFGFVGGALAVLLVLFWPWSTRLTFQGQPTFGTSGLVAMEAPGLGLICSMGGSEGDVIPAGQPLFTWQELASNGAVPFQGARLATSRTLFAKAMPAPTYLTHGYTPGNGGMSGEVYTNFGVQEQTIRMHYRQLQEEASGHTRNCQEQVNQAMRDLYSRRGGQADVEMAQRNLQRAMEAPQELNARMEQELAALRSTRDLVLRGMQTQTPAPPSLPGAQAVTAEEPVMIWRWLVRNGERVQEHQACLAALPRSADIRIVGVMPASQRGLVSVGGRARMESHTFLQDGVETPLEVESVASRVLDWDEVASLAPSAEKDVPYVLITLRALDADHPIFPPPLRGAVKLDTRRLSLLRRLFLRLTA